MPLARKWRIRAQMARPLPAMEVLKDAMIIPHFIVVPGLHDLAGGEAFGNRLRILYLKKYKLENEHEPAIILLFKQYSPLKKWFHSKKKITIQEMILFFSTIRDTRTVQKSVRI